MEQAVNTFTKGLQNDTHPMVQGNDTLSDALNATFITMNGNEVVLQNDMGNRRVDNAFLPAGYEPVGIKEYGGIIYVAAYNPLTGRGQLGSFPSPERKFSPSETKSTNISFDDFVERKLFEGDSFKAGVTYYKEQENQYIQVSSGEQFDSNVSYYTYIVKNNSIIQLLTDKTILHAGDKFSIYSSDIINFLNVSQNINYILPENNYKKLFTFKVGILNSQNEFVDITDTLLKDNNNYFIFQENGNYEFTDTKSDKELLKERNGFQNLNTYSYKIVSPLYLKVELNYIKQVQYRVYGEKNSNNTYDLEVTMIYTHENDIDFNSYIPDSNLESNPAININIKGSTTNEEGETVTEVAYTYFGLSPNNGIIHCEFSHYLYPIDFYQQSNRIYIEDLYWEEDIDVSKLGSDTIEFNGWKYFNYLNDDNSRSILSLNLQTYPKRQSNLKYLYLIIKENSTIKQVSLLYQGSEEEPIPSGIWETSFIWEGIDKRKVYNCELRSSNTLLEELINNKNSTQIGYIINSNSTLIRQDLIFISTTLFNNNYNGKENLKDEAYILDGNNKRIGIKYDYTRDKNAYIEDFSFISNIIVTPTADVSLSVNQNLTRDQSATTSTNSTDYTRISIKDEFNSRITINKSVKVLNEELYPSNISFNGVTITISNNKKILYNNQELNDINPTLIKGKKTGSLDNNILSETITSNNNNNILNIKIVVKNQLKGDAELQTITTNNAIISFAKFLEENQSLMNVKKPFFSIDSESGEYFSINYVNSDSQDSTYTDINRKRLSTGYYDRDSSIINNYITSVNNDLFVGEQNGDDCLYITGFGSGTTTGFPEGTGFPLTEGSGTNVTYWNKWFYRIWFQYDQGKYIPIYIISCNGENEYNNFDFSNMYTYINNWANNFGPSHYYNYVRESRSVQMSIVDLDNIDHYLLSDFDSINCDLSMHYVLGGGNNISIPNNYSGLFVVPTNNLDNLETKDIIKNIGKIHSNSTFNSLIEKLQTLDFDCVGMYYSSYAYNQGNKVALVDVDGNFLDSTYVYKLVNYGNANIGLKKCYQPIRKYTIGDKIVLPNFYQESYLAENSIPSYVSGGTIDGITNVVMTQDEPNIHSSYPYIPPVIGRSRYYFNKIPNIKQL